MMRHAEALETFTGRDFDRPLIPDGSQHAARVASILTVARPDWRPTLILSSNALRSRATLDAMAPSLGPIDTHLYGSLYTAAALDGGECLAELVALLLHHGGRGEGGPSPVVLCVGHNKGWEEASTALAGEPVRLRNACAALLEAPCLDWGEALRGLEISGSPLTGDSARGGGSTGSTNQGSTIRGTGDTPFRPWRLVEVVGDGPGPGPGA